MPIRVALRAYGPLNDFLDRRNRFRTTEFELGGPTTVKDLVESAGIPHVEVDVVIVNGVAAEFGRLVADGDRIAAYPRFFAVDPGDAARIRRSPEPRRFVLDVHLGRLARHLRLAGLDAAYGIDTADHALARVAAEQGRTLLTRDVGLLKRGAVEHGYWIRSTTPHDQFVEVLRRYRPLPLAPFSRCLRCNGDLLPVPKESIADRLPPRTRERYVRFRRCSACGGLFWEGTHYDRLAAALEAALAEAGSGERR